MDNKYSRGQILIHKKTGVNYGVIKAPTEHELLAYCDEPYYSYRSYGTESDHIIWVRSKSEIEDGRFDIRET